MESLVKEGTVGEVLYRSRIITEEDIRKALDEQQLSGCRFGEALVKLGIVDQEDIDWALSNQLDIPYVHLTEAAIDPAAVALVPVEVARRHGLIPIIRSEDELHIALADPLNRKAVEEVERITGCRVTVSIPVMRELSEMQDLFYGPVRDEISFCFSSDSFSDSILEKINADSSGSRMLENLILFFLQNGIDSLSIQPSADSVRVSVRRGREFREIGSFSTASYPVLLRYVMKLSRINDTPELVKEGKTVFTFRDCDVVLRVSMIRAADGECITIRLWSNDTFPETVSEMGGGAEIRDRFRTLSEINRGLVLFSSMNRLERCRLLDLYLDAAETSGKNVLLIGEKIGRGNKSFPRVPVDDGGRESLEVLVSALEDHDPDVLVIEDATDSRAFVTAWKSAMRRKLVVAGLTCSGISGAVDYLLSERHFNHSVMAGVSGIASLSGVRTLCPHCRESCRPSADDMDPLDFDIYGRGKGCTKCGYSGLNGMRYLLGIVSIDPEVRTVFESARDGGEFLRHLNTMGYGNAEGELTALMRNGEISPEEYSTAILQL